MRKLICFLLFVAITSYSYSQGEVDKLIKVNPGKLDFGKMKYNQPQTSSFLITNISNKPIVIEKSWGACGCTTPELIKEPIMPGKSVPLKVSYNANTRGHFTKEVYIKVAGVVWHKTVLISGEVE